MGFVGKAAGWAACCDTCKAKANENPPCAAWVFIHDGHCYQKYDTGSFAVRLLGGPDRSGSDAGILAPAPTPAPTPVPCQDWPHWKQGHGFTCQGFFAKNADYRCRYYGGR